MADYITTWSGIHFTPLEPKKEEIRAEDIAHALSLMTRANGHFPEFYSVAQHCIHCCEEAGARSYSARVQAACLLHDGSEAYLADITRPVKKHLPGYLSIEEVLQSAIYEKFLGEPLTEEEERRYLAQAQKGDLEARNVLIERNLRLVAHIMNKRYCARKLFLG